MWITPDTIMEVWTGIVVGIVYTIGFGLMAILIRRQVRMLGWDQLPHNAKVLVVACLPSSIGVAMWGTVTLTTHAYILFSV